MKRPATTRLGPMHPNRSTARTLSFATAILLTGCTTRWRPPMQGVEQAPAALRVDLSKRLAPANTRYIYQRVSLSPNDTPPVEYPILHLPQGIREGAFAANPVDSLDIYFADNQPEGRKLDGSLWPKPWINGTAGMLLRFDPPIVHLPTMLDANHPWHAKSSVDICDPKGRQLFTATADRSAQVEGYETVSFNNQTYPDCVRVRADTRIHLSWIARVDIAEYLWLAPSKGCVQRIQAVDGWVFFRNFEDVVEDRLLRTETVRPHDTTAPPIDIYRQEVWSAAAIFFNPSWPHPHLAGVVADYARNPDWIVDE